MFHYSDAQIDQWILDDANLGDLTTRALGIGDRAGRMEFRLKHGGRASGIAPAAKLLQKLDVEIVFRAADGFDLPPKAPLLVAVGPAARLHSGWKAAQNILEWSCGVAAYVADMLARGRAHSSTLHVACTRKMVPGTKLLANAAVHDGGGILHRGGLGESILLFANHRVFWDDPADFSGQVARLRAAAPEKHVIVEAATMDEAALALAAGPDILQLDKFSPEDARTVIERAATVAPHCVVSVAGGVTRENIARYAAAGVSLVVSSAPYAAPPADVGVCLQPE